MHQPVRWHEWGPEAFATAQLENKPILLDIGAVWCHWCHVMDRESYDDPQVAEIVNKHFIAVKVDRDERPDIDSRYQAAVQALSQQGGWPLTAFLTPDGKPFYGGTYFPPAEGYGRPSFRRVLLSIANAYTEKHGDVMEQAKMVESAIVQSESFAGKSGQISASVITAIQTSALRMFDPQHGGFGQAPKFPHPSALDLLMERYARSGSATSSPADDKTGQMATANKDQALRDVIVSTLEHMAKGGVYDQLAGGFHRYSVDERWVVPHFEKMCYDNSELLKNYVHAYQATGNVFFAEVAKDIIRWMDEWLSDRQRGGFYASQDADISMDDDGDYFTWTVDEARAVLTKEEAAVAELHYDIHEIGEMHHNPAKNVLYVRASLQEIAQRINLPELRVAELLASAKRKMYAARLQRQAPYVDKTVYVGWNCMCVSAYLEAAKVLNLAEARRFALKSLDRVLGEAWKAGSRTEQPLKGTQGEAGTGADALLHVVSYSDPKAEHREVSGMLEDYAFTTLACLDAYEATSDLSYFKFAQAIAAAMIERFYDATSGGFFDREPFGDGQSLGVLATRRKPLQDSPTPAGNPVAAIALMRLHHYTGDSSYKDKAELTLETFAGVVEQFGIFAATYGIAVVQFLESPAQVVVIRADGDDQAAEDLYSAAVASFAFIKSTLRLNANQAVAENLPPALAATIPNLPQLSSKNSFAVLCSGSACQPPVTDAGHLRRTLEVALGRT